MTSKAVRRSTQALWLNSLAGNGASGASGAYIVAPMVDQSELAFRMLCREFGAHVCYTPMIHSRLFVECDTYREEIFATCKEDRPLIIQFCGNDPLVLQQAAEMVQDQCDAIDLNLGCPQGIARRGNYGAFLLEQPDVVEEIVKHLASTLTVPVTCKIRVLHNEEETLKLAKRLENAGCSLLTLHGRSRHENKEAVRCCNWKLIRRVKEALDIPVVANGGIFNLADAHRCLQETQCDGVMVSETILENPAVFSNGYHPQTGIFYDQLDLASRYLQLAQEYGSFRKQVRSHLFKMLHGGLQDHLDLRVKLAKIPTSSSSFFADMEEIVARLREHFPPQQHAQRQAHRTTPNLETRNISPSKLQSLSEQLESIVLCSSGQMISKIASEIHEPSNITFPLPGSWYYRHQHQVREADTQGGTAKVFAKACENQSTLKDAIDNMQREKDKTAPSNDEKPSESELRKRAYALKEELLKKHRFHQRQTGTAKQASAADNEEQDTSTATLFGE
eukprot:gb/GECG01013261.1/.p1 GENE.gb/GECG01013261.1/~~gb/GECG01013261.1/.p1  ORF type:complete len:505 (+),score=63.13 gb/GECG01013261.1/:1-1515(+)